MTLHPAGVVNMASKSIAGLRPVPLAAMVPGGSARRHSHRCRLLRLPCSSSTFLRSLRSRPITALPRCRARHITPAVSSSLSYGLVIHLLLLSTPPRDDAVAVGYKLR